jgi:ArsR family transcriptional regulator
MKTATKKRRTPLNPADYRIRAEVANALANANRMMIIDALARKGEMCVCEIVEMLGCDQSTASKHLALLKNAGLVTDRREGHWAHYSLICPCVANLFQCIEDVISSRLRRQQDSLNGLLGRKG